MDSPKIFRVSKEFKNEFALRNRAICKLLTQSPIDADDFAIIQRMHSGNRFAQCLGYLSIFENLNVTSMKSWMKYIEKVVDAAGTACKREFENKYELRLFSYAVAIRTFPDGMTQIRQLAPFDLEELQGIASLKIDSDERVWAMYIFGNAVLDYLSTDANREFHTFLRLMISLATAKEKYSEVNERLPHFENMGVFVYADQE